MNVYWLEQTRAEVPSRDDWLSTAELAQLRALRFPKRREDWRLGRWTGKCAVASYLGVPARPRDFAAIEIRAALSGAPEVFIGGRPAGLGISLSHRENAGLCTVASPNLALGCDLELIEPRSPAFLADYFTGKEQVLISQAGHDHLLMAALLWSAKESALKAMRTGLRLDTRSVVVTPVESGINGGWRSLRVDHAATAFHGWWRCSGDLVCTFVSAPGSAPPIELAPAPRVLMSAVTEKNASSAYV